MLRPINFMIMVTTIISSIWLISIPWTVIGVGVIIILWLFIGSLIWKIPHQSELSLEANAMINKYTYYFTNPNAGREFSSMASAVQITAIVVSVIHGFQYSWMSLVPGICGYILMFLGSIHLNPAELIAKTGDQSVYEEALNWTIKTRSIKPNASNEINNSIRPGADNENADLQINLRKESRIESEESDFVKAKELPKNTESANEKNSTSFNDSFNSLGRSLVYADLSKQMEFAKKHSLMIGLSISVFAVHNESRAELIERTNLLLIFGLSIQLRIPNYRSTLRF
jgi:hypothetical protein